MNKPSKRKTILLSIGIILAIAIVIVAIRIIADISYNSSHSAFLEIEYQPIDATVLLDGETINVSTDPIRITPGNHSVAIIHSGFFPEGVEFSVEEGETYSYSADLSPYTDEASDTSDAF